MNELTPKQRILSTIRGEAVDRVPWSPFLAYFWEAQPVSVQEQGQLSFLEDVGADPLLRGFYKDKPLNLFKTERKNCDRQLLESEREKKVIYETPVGNLQETYRYSENGDTWFLVEHPVKSKEDFKILTYINENTSIHEDSEKAEDFAEETGRIGDRALHLALIGTGTTEKAFKSSLQAMVEHWVGTEQLVFSLFDYPEVVEETLQAMKKNSIETVRKSVETVAEAFLFWEDSSTTNISPDYFRKYIAPEIDEWGKLIHDADKLLIHHACGHLKDLIPLMAKTEIDMIESISPPPTGNIELWDAKDGLPENIGLIGGIEPTNFLNLTHTELTEYVKKLLNKMGKIKFVLANSDSCPPGVTKEKFKLVSELVQEFGM